MGTQIILLVLLCGGSLVYFLQHNDRALVYIEENSRLADVIFPVPPIVVSLRDYDDVGVSAQKLPTQGYPVVCVSVSMLKICKFWTQERLL